MKTHDLSAVLHDHADLPETAHTVRMAALRTRVRRVRRRRAFVAVACVALALVGGAVAGLPSRPDSQPAKPDPFPEHLAGSRIVAQTSGRTPDPLALAFTPSDTAELTLFIGCETGTKSNLKAVLSIDGKEVKQSPCHSGSTGISTNETRELLVPGRQSVVRLTVLGRITSIDTTVEDAAVEPAEDGIAVRLGVGREVPLAEYPMPPAPPEPVEVDGLVHAADVVLRSDPADPNQPQRIVVPWRAITKTHIVVGSPGRVRVVVAGTTVDDMTSFSYTATGSLNGAVPDFPDLVPGQPVEISAIPEAQHGEWAVMVDMDG
ncbi:MULTISPECIES: hypothetical protein [unclassified Saccharothrix]|uniref:hypothetical protein n=1 Tax=unclassified Saccharothrix TaxID=2593673 RepID=UPI00307DA70D